MICLILPDIVLSTSISEGNLEGLRKVCHEEVEHCIRRSVLTKQMHVSVVIVVTVTIVILTGVSGYPPNQHIPVAQHPNIIIRCDRHFGGLLYNLNHPQDNTDRSSRNIGRYTLKKVLHRYLHTPLHLDYIRHVKSPKIRCQQPWKGHDTRHKFYGNCK